MNEYLSDEEIAAARQQALQDSPDGSIDITAMYERLTAETGRQVRPPAPAVDESTLPPAAREQLQRMRAQSAARLHALIAAGERRSA
jgi:hypothetical protein